MYRVGFGDCFLLSLPTAKGGRQGDTHEHILVDCGVHGRGDIGTMGRVVENIASVTGRRLAVVIATHAHQDHISGYDKFGAAFSQFQIEEVWLPWTWDPDNRRAVKLQKKQLALTAQLEEQMRALAADGRANVKAANAVENLRGNAHAIALLKSGFGVNARVRYLKAGDRLSADSRGVGADRRLSIAGLSVNVLGPPESEEFLSQMDPPAGQRYLRMTEDGAAEANPLRPFPQKWLAPEGDRGPRLTADEERELRESAVFPTDQLAFALDQARNNESLVTLFICRGQYLLFPGDAQYGNWRAWLEEEQAEDILSRISFFKVAHHGSHNATPKNALERMSEGKFAAMVSTQSTPWSSIPRVPLMKRLGELAVHKVVRSDWLDIEGAPAPSEGAEPPRPARLPAGFRKGDFWFDYLIEV